MRAAAFAEMGTTWATVASSFASTFRRPDRLFRTPAISLLQIRKNEEIR
jgi:hypothetical protein